ncbi:MAG: class II aldolase/adducin family protein [Armatimonadota bacterium]|nr:class II aldolase/adducin family protein [bacterium]
MDERMALEQLIGMSREIARPELDAVILGEGNTSAKISDDEFFVKASGKYLCQSDENTFVKVDLKGALAVLDGPDLTDDQTKDALFNLRIDKSNPLKPSIETTFHAFLLSQPDVNFVAHTHATAINMITCSTKGKEIIRGRICPDEIVYCGIEPIWIDFVEPGVALGRAIREKVITYQDKHGCNPKTIMMQNHGLVALGRTAHECEAITQMAIKTARVLLGAMAFGGIHYLTEENVMRIYNSSGKAYRRQQFE